MKKKETHLYTLLKIKQKHIVDAKYNLTLTKDEQKEFLVKLPNSPLFNQLSIVRGHEPKDKHISEFIFVEAKRNVQKEDELRRILRDGFTYNKIKYVRFGKSPSQGKDGITTFIAKDYYEKMNERSHLGLDIKKCVISKYESYRSLIFSSCTLVNHELPNIVIIGEFEKVIKNQDVRYADTEDVTVTDKVTGEQKVFKNQRVIKNGKTDIKISPFDGFGVHTPEFNAVLSNAISDDNESSLYQIRLPFMKGVTIEFNFVKYFKDVLEQDTITDIFGVTHKIEDVDCIWNTTMWKGHSYFKNEFGDDAWKTYLERLDTYEYKLGISKYSHKMKDINLYSRMNFQYLQCLDLNNPKYIEKFKKHDNTYDVLDEVNDGKIVKMARYSTDFVENIVNGEKISVLKYLGIHNTSDMEEVNSKYTQAILINDEMLNDICVKKMLKRKLNKTINLMKFGKIYVRGFYHTVVGDIIGYLEFAGGKKPTGCLKYGEFYARTLPLGRTTSMRSPLVDPSEVNNVELVENDVTKKWLSHLEGQDIVMINMYDLSMQQQGGMDEDGDSVLLTNEPIVVNSKIDLPIVVDMEDKKGAEPKDYTTENLVEYELNSRDSRIGEITNIATSILNTYTEDQDKIKMNSDNIALLRLFQGKEIDFLKTGFRWHLTKNLRNYLKRLPYFLLYNYPNKLNTYNKVKHINKKIDKPEDKIQTNAFHSPTAMNELCDYICQWERKNINWAKADLSTGNLLVNHRYDYSNKKLIREIRRAFNEYTVELKFYIDEDLKTDGLKKKYKEYLNDLNSKYGIDELEFINYCIKASYSTVSVDKSLCWLLYGDVMLNNLRSNSNPSVHKKIVECRTAGNDTQEFLGRYYKLEEVGDTFAE